MHLLPYFAMSLKYLILDNQIIEINKIANCAHEQSKKVEKKIFPVRLLLTCRVEPIRILKSNELKNGS